MSPGDEGAESGLVLPQPHDLVEVGAGAEMLALGADQNGPDISRRLELVEGGGDAIGHRAVETVEFGRPGELDDAYVLVPFDPHRLLAVRHLPSFRSCSSAGHQLARPYVDK